MRNFSVFLLVISFMITDANMLMASSFKGGDNVKISSPVNEDLYLAGGEISINASILGDLVCAGGEISIQDTISEDLIAAGGDLHVEGFIGDDVRVAGGSVFINSAVRGDLIVAGGEVSVGRDAIIFGDLHVAGGELSMDGVVKGLVSMSGGDVSWNGEGESDFVAKAGNLSIDGIIRGSSELSAGNITIGNEAKLYGDVSFWNSKGELDFGNALQNGATANYNPDLKVNNSDFNWKYLGLGIVAFWIYRLLAAALMLALLIWIFHQFFSSHSDEINQNYGSHIGYGFLYIVGVPVAAILTFITIIGIPIGLITMTLYGISISLGYVIAALLIAYGVNHHYSKGYNRKQIYFVAIAGFIVLKLIAAIPFLGILLSILILATALGTLFSILWESRSKELSV